MSGWPNACFINLGEIYKPRLDNVLSGTGCEVLFTK